MNLRPRVIINVAVLVLATSAVAARLPGSTSPAWTRRSPPGDDFFAYANGAWLKSHRDPAPTAASWGTGAIARRAHRASAPPSSSPRRPRRSAPAGSDARKIGDYYASFMDEAGIEQKGLAPLAAGARSASPPSPTPTAWRARSARTLRADVDVLNNTNFDTDNLFGLWVAQDLDDPTRYAPFLLQGGLGLPDRDYYLDASPRMAEIRAKYQAHIAAMLDARRHRRRRRRRRRASSSSRGSIAAGARAARRHRGRRRRATTTGRAPTSRQGAAGSTGTPSSPPPGSTSRQSFVVWQPAAVTGIAALVASRAARDLEGLPDVPRHRARRARSCPRRSSTRASPSTARRSTARRSCASAGSAPSTPPTTRSARRSASSTSRSYFPPAEKARAEEMVRNMLAAFAHAHRRARLDGAGDQGARPRPSSPRSRSASAIPTSGATTRRSRSCAATRSATPSAPTLFEYQRNLAQARPAGRSRRVGDERRSWSTR